VSAFVIACSINPAPAISVGEVSSQNSVSVLIRRPTDCMVE
jgi:hypothetical protein